MHPLPKVGYRKIIGYEKISSRVLSWVHGGSRNNKAGLAKVSRITVTVTTALVRLGLTIVDVRFHTSLGVSHGQPVRCHLGSFFTRARARDVWMDPSFWI